MSMKNGYEYGTQIQYGYRPGDMTNPNPKKVGYDNIGKRRHKYGYIYACDMYRAY